MISDPQEIEQVFKAPPDVLHPGEGAHILEPIIGRHSVILLDEDPHLEQRKLLLPAFHGERMRELTGLMEELAEREVGTWPTGEPFELHPRFQALTLEIILRAFGFEVGERLETLKERATEILDFGTSFASLNQHLWRSFGGRGPWARFVLAREAADELVYAQIDERRRSGERRDDVLSMLLEARPDGSEMSRAEIRDELLTALTAGHETTESELARHSSASRASRASCGASTKRSTRARTTTTSPPRSLRRSDAAPYCPKPSRDSSRRR